MFVYDSDGFIEFPCMDAVNKKRKALDRGHRAFSCRVCGRNLCNQNRVPQRMRREGTLTTQGGKRHETHSLVLVNTEAENIMISEKRKRFTEI